MTTDTATAERHATGRADESAATTANSVASHDDNIARTPNKNWSILPRVLLLIIGLVILAAEILVAVRLGSASLSVEDVWDAVVSGVFQLPVEETFRKTFTVIFALRFPRVLLAVLAGAALATSGVVMQALLRNPLVSPFTLGVSPAAAFGAALTILVLSQRGISAPSQLVALGALVSALAVSALVLGLSKTRASSTATLLLLGIAMTQLFEA
ncbi:MAG: iron ABC transporter permease, partial [Bifidobacterium crudilactis]|nr:iron ABC transporter permease [Bifidobacterium crudilactis]